jgi:hypothetical protein
MSGGKYKVIANNLCVKRLAICSLLIFAAKHSFGQAQTSAAAVPDSFLYRTFFSYVTSLEHAADLAAARGSTNSTFRHRVKNDCGLTVAEEASLKAIVADFRLGYADAQAQAATISASFPAHTALSADARKTLANLKAQIGTSTTSHVQQLQVAFGPQRFQVLDAYVRRTILPGVSVKPVQGGQQD